MELSTLNLYINGQIIEPIINENIYSYTYLNVISDLLIEIEYDKEVYSLTYTDGVGYSFSNYESSVIHGGSSSFTITFEDGYDTSVLTNLPFDFNYSCNSDSNNVYIYYCDLMNASKDLIISLNVDKQVFKIDYTNTAGYQVLDEFDAMLYKEVDYGSNINFKIVFEADYNVDAAIVSVNNQVIEKDINGLYSIENVNENIYINVEGHYKDIVNLEYLENSGYLVWAREGYTGIDMPRGSDFEFTIFIDAVGYHLEGDLYVKFNNQILESTDGIYRIENIQTDGIILVGDLVKNEYLLQTDGDDSFYLTDINGEPLGENFKQYDQVDFKVVVSPLYQGTPIVFVNGNDISRFYNVETDSYKMPIYADNIVSVEGLIVREANINYDVDSPNEILSIDLSSVLQVTVNMKETLDFVVKVDSTYRVSESGLIVENNGVELERVYFDEIGNYHYYRIENVDSDINITVTGLELKPRNLIFDEFNQGILIFDDLDNSLDFYNEIDISTLNITVRFEFDELLYDVGDYYISYRSMSDYSTIDYLYPNESGLFVIPMKYYDTYIEYIGVSYDTYSITFVLENDNFVNLNTNVHVEEYIPASLNISLYNDFLINLLPNSIDNYQIFTDESKTVLLYDYLTVNSDMKVYIVNKVSNYNLKFVINNQIDSDIQVFVDQNVTGEYINNIVNFSNKENHIFKGWTLTSSNVGKVYNFDDFDFTNLGANLVFYAKWIPEFSIIFDNQGIGDPIAPIIVTQNYLNSREYANIFDRSNYVSLGYTFYGWYTQPIFNDDQYLANEYTIINSNDNITLYAKWIADYHISFDMSGNGIQIDPLLINNEVIISNFKQMNLLPLAEGYLFDGWYKENTFVNKIYPGDFINFEVDTTIYAKWTMVENILLDDPILGNWYSNQDGVEKFISIDSNNFNIYYYYDENSYREENYQLYKTGENVYFISKEDDNYQITLENGSLKYFDEYYSLDSKVLIKFVDGVSDEVKGLGIFDLNSTIDLPIYYNDLGRIYHYYKDDLATIYFDSSIELFVNSENVILYGYNFIVQDITIDFYVSVEGYDNVDDIIVNSTDRNDLEIENIIVENYIFQGWYNEGVKFESIMDVIKYVGDGNYILLTANLVEKIDYSTERILGKYFISSGNMMTIEFFLDGRIEVTNYDFENNSTNIGYWRKINEIEYSVFINGNEEKYYLSVGANPIDDYLSYAEIGSEFVFVRYEYIDNVVDYTSEAIVGDYISYLSDPMTLNLDVFGVITFTSGSEVIVGTWRKYILNSQERYIINVDNYYFDMDYFANTNSLLDRLIIKSYYDISFVRSGWDISIVDYQEERIIGEYVDDSGLHILLNTDGSLEYIRFEGEVEVEHLYGIYRIYESYNLEIVYLASINSSDILTINLLNNTYKEFDNITFNYNSSNLNLSRKMNFDLVDYSLERIVGQYSYFDTEYSIDVEFVNDGTISIDVLDNSVSVQYDGFWRVYRNDQGMEIYIIYYETNSNEVLFILGDNMIDDHVYLSINFVDVVANRIL